MNTIVHCKVKKNAEIIAKILDCDVDGEEFLKIEDDGTLIIDLPIDVEKVNRVNVHNSKTHIGNLYYVD